MTHPISDDRVLAGPAIPKEPAMTTATTELPEHLRGDGPCTDCGTLNNIIWFTDSVFWNEVCRQGDYIEPTLCVPCFVARTEAAGLSPTGWRVVPEFHWETHGEWASRRDDVRWLVWSHEHHAWWKPNRCGYTGDMEQAGRYREADAARICDNPHWGDPERPNEVMVLSPEAQPIPAGQSIGREMDRRVQEATRLAVEAQQSTTKEA